MSYFKDDPKRDAKDEVKSDVLGQGEEVQEEQGSITPSDGSSHSGGSQITTQNQTGTQGALRPSKGGSGGRPSGFVDVKKYVDKNKPAGAKIADKTYEQIGQASKAANQARKQAIQNFTNEASSGGLQNTQQKVADIKSYSEQQAGLAQAPENSQFQESDFQNIINARYEGPKNLAETGNIYQDLRKTADETARLGQQAQTGSGRQDMLRNMFSQNREYTSGMGKLDEVLMRSQGQKIQDIKQAGKMLGTSDDIMRQAGEEALGISSGLEKDIARTRQQSRDAFSSVAGTRQKQVDDRVDSVVANWDKLPAHFRDAVSNPDGTVNLSKIEAATLGVQEGEGLYNLTGEDLFGTAENQLVEADRGRLISKDEQGNLARLQALSNMAQTDESLYDIGEYFDTEQAGTQSILDALDLEGVRGKLSGAEQSFRDQAAKDITGKGKDYERYSRGWGQARGKAHGSATKTANLKDILSAQGYDFDQDINTQDNSNIDILKNLGALTSSTEEGIDDNDILNPLGGLDYNEVLDKMGIGGDIDNLKNAPGDIAQQAGEGLSENVDELIGQDLANISGISPALDAIRSLGGSYNNLTTSLFGGGKSSARKKAQKSAEKKATADLQNKLNKQFSDSGFKNRVGVSDTEETSARNQALVNLLKELGVG